MHNKRPVLTKIFVLFYQCNKLIFIELFKIYTLYH